MERTAINPWTWSSRLGFDQAHLIAGQRRQLVLSGQDSVDAKGAPRHPGDMGAQLGLAIDNLETVLAAVEMSLADVVRLNVYTTDVDLLLPHYGVPASRLGAAGVAPAMTLLGVARLAIPGQAVELEGTAVA